MSADAERVADRVVDFVRRHARELVETLFARRRDAGAYVVCGALGDAERSLARVALLDALASATPSTYARWLREWAYVVFVDERDARCPPLPDAYEPDDDVVVYVELDAGATPPRVAAARLVVLPVSIAPDAAEARAAAHAAPRACLVCATPTTSRCTACKLARYCSRECQRANWRVHRTLCANAARVGGALLKQTR